MNYTCAANRFHDYDAILPIYAHVPYGYLWGYDLDITDPSHPITTQVNDFGFGVEGLAEWCPGGTKTGSDILAEYVQNNRESVVYWSTGPAQGRVAYVGPFFLADADNFATLQLFQDPDAVRLLVNAVRWVSSSPRSPKKVAVAEEYGCHGIYYDGKHIYITPEKPLPNFRTGSSPELVTFRSLGYYNAQVSVFLPVPW